jgi:hypothetical protein
MPHVRLEVWNHGSIVPIDDVHVFLDSLKPGQIARRELAWVGQGIGGMTLRAQGHAHFELLTFDSKGNCFLQTASQQQLQPRKYSARLIVESKVGSLPVHVIIDPSRRPPVKIRGH